MTNEQHQRYVLMIEDDPDDIFFAEYWMRELSIQIPTHFVQESESVFPWLDSRQTLPSVIILDRHLPGTDGIEILKQLKAHPLYCSIPVVILSGTGFPEEIKACYAAGAASFVLKPKRGTEQVAEGINIFLSYWFNFCQLPPTEKTDQFSLHA